MAGTWTRHIVAVFANAPKTSAPKGEVSWEGPCTSLGHISREASSPSWASQMVMPAAYEQCLSVGGLSSVSGPGPASAPASCPSVPHIPWVSKHDCASTGLAHFGTHGLPRPCPQYCSVPFRLLRASLSGLTPSQLPGL